MIEVRTQKQTARRLFRGVRFTGLVALVVAAGCARTVVSTHPLVTGQLPRPARVWVYDFAATAADLPANSEMASQIAAVDAPQTPEDLATGRQLGAQLATELVVRIREMGMSAEHAVAGTSPQINDIVLQGCILGFDEGDATKRVTVGFGRGASELRVAAEGFQVTEQGWRKLGSGSTDSGGSKTPGAAMGAVTFLATANRAGLIVCTGMKVYGEKSGSSKLAGRTKQTAKEIANVLRERFKQQGWVR